MYTKHIIYFSFFLLLLVHQKVQGQWHQSPNGSIHTMSSVGIGKEASANHQLKLSIAGGVHTDGAGSGFWFQDRDNKGRMWSWYGASNSARLWNGEGSHILEISPEGGLKVLGSGGAVYFTDRNNADRSWGWYGEANTARFWNGDTGSLAKHVLEISPDGMVKAVGDRSAYVYKDRINGQQWGWYANGGKTLLWNGTLTNDGVLAVTEAGNMGIGTLNPNYRMHVVGTQTGSNGAQLMVEGIQGNHAMLAIKSPDTTKVANMTFLNGANNQLWSISSRWDFESAQGSHPGNDALKFSFNDGRWAQNSGEGWGVPLVLQKFKATINGTAQVNGTLQMNLPGAGEPDILFTDGGGLSKGLRIVFNGDKQLGIATTPEGGNGGHAHQFFEITPEKMSYMGNIFYTREIEVNASGTGSGNPEDVMENKVPDYVFDKSYKLRTLEELKDFIDKNHHLPGVMSAKEVADNGNRIPVGKMQLSQLEKIEELTLYIFQLQEQLKQQEAKFNKQQEEIDQLKKKMHN